mgnify:CR=1 FL=1
MESTILPDIIRKSLTSIARPLLTRPAVVRGADLPPEKNPVNRIAKALTADELLARLRVIERRLSTSRSPLLKIGKVTLDTMEQCVHVDGEKVEMSRREYMLLKSLLDLPVTCCSFLLSCVFFLPL